MAKVLAAGVFVVVVLGVIAQLVVPGFVERDIEGNLLEADGGATAVVDVQSFPVARLLVGSGDRFKAQGRGIRVDLSERTADPLDRLDGFDEVDIEFTDVTAGPVWVRRFSLVKAEDADVFSLRMDAMTTPRAVAEAVGGEFAGELGRLLASAGASALPGGGEVNVPISLDGPVSRPDGGGVDAAGVEASVAAVPAGPFAEAMVAAVLERM